MIMTKKGLWNVLYKDVPSTSPDYSEMVCADSLAEVVEYLNMSSRSVGSITCCETATVIDNS